MFGKKHQKYTAGDYPLTAKAISDLEEFNLSLLPEEKAKCGLEEGFDYDYFANQNTFCLGMSDKDSAKEIRDRIEEIKGDVSNFRCMKEFAAANLDIPNLLARYSKLSDLWRLYVRKHISGDDDDDEDDRWMFTSMAAIDMEKENDPGQYIDTIKSVNEILLKVEAVQ